MADACPWHYSSFFHFACLLMILLHLNIFCGAYKKKLEAVEIVVCFLCNWLANSWCMSMTWLIFHSTSLPHALSLPDVMSLPVVCLYHVVCFISTKYVVFFCLIFFGFSAFFRFSGLVRLSGFLLLTIFFLVDLIEKFWGPYNFLGIPCVNFALIRV